MSDEKPITTPDPIPTEKQYLLTADDTLMAFIRNIIPGMRFIQVEAMSIPENPLHQILVNPVAKVVVEGVGESPEESEKPIEDDA